MITIRRQLMGLGFIAASSLLALHSANAMNGPAAITVDGGPLGQLSVTGGFDAYGYYFNPSTSIPGGPRQKDNGIEVGETQIEVQKTSGIVQFTVEIGTEGGAWALGTTGRSQTSLGSTTNAPLYVGTVTIAPPGSPVTFTAGQIGSVEGYEGSFDWGNPTQFATDMFQVENSSSRGVALNFTEGPLSGTVEFGDGWDDGVWNFLQAIVNYTISPTNTLTVFTADNLGRTGLFAKSYGCSATGFGACTPVYAETSNYVNSDMIGFFDSATFGNLNLIPEVQYVIAKEDAKALVVKPTWNLGGAVLYDYTFGTTPYSVGGFVEYFASHTSTADAANGTNWFIGPDAAAVGIAVSPTWQYKAVFARANLGYLYLTNNKNPDGTTVGYGNSGTGRSLFSGTLEAGLLF